MDTKHMAGALRAAAHYLESVSDSTKFEETAIDRIIKEKKGGLAQTHTEEQYRNCLLDLGAITELIKKAERESHNGGWTSTLIISSIKAILQRV